MAGIPLESKGKVRGVLCLISRQPDRFGEEDLKLLVDDRQRDRRRHRERLALREILRPFQEDGGAVDDRQPHRPLQPAPFLPPAQGRDGPRQAAEAFRCRCWSSISTTSRNTTTPTGICKGDEALRGVAQAITASIRQDVDDGFRYGGDEFAVILPYSDSDEAAEVAERIRKTFEDFGLDGTSLSIGLAELDYEEEVDDFVTRADSAMYVAKNSGGNRVHKA